MHLDGYPTLKDHFGREELRQSGNEVAEIVERQGHCRDLKHTEINNNTFRSV